MLKCMDIVIAPDCGLAHLSCALGVETWVLLQKHCDWRWANDEKARQWYPMARLFRQQRQGVWSDVVESLRQALIEATAAR